MERDQTTQLRLARVPCFLLLLIAVGCQTRLASPTAPLDQPAGRPHIAIPDFADLTERPYATGLDQVLPWRVGHLGQAFADEAALQLTSSGKYRVTRLPGPFLGEVTSYQGYDGVLAGYVESFSLGADLQNATWFSPVSLLALLGLPALYVLEYGTAKVQVNLIDPRQDKAITTYHCTVAYGPVHQFRGLSNMKGRRERAGNLLRRQTGDRLLLRLLEAD